jgi:hypothetical protein
MSRLIRAWKNESIFFLRKYSRFILPIFIVVVAKLIGSIFLYSSLDMGSSDTYWMKVNWDTEGQNAILKSTVEQGMRWPYLFLGWDSAWYLAIVIKGYAFSNLSYPFFPGLPLFGWLLNQILENPTIALVGLSFVLGILWIPIYQLFAENYMDKPKALKSTLFYAFFPYVFLFTTVTYAEGLFLFSTLCAWYLFKKGKTFSAMLSASVAAISRAPGLLIILPISVETIQKYRRSRSSFQLRNMFYFFIPIFCLLSWLLYLSFNGWFPPSTQTGWSGMYSFRTLVFTILPERGIQALSDYFKNWPFSFAFIPFLLIAPFLILVLARTDKALALYSVAYLLGVLAFGGLASIPRFISFIFPMWLPLASKLFQAKRSNLITWIVCASFLLIGLFLWFSFLNGEFVS